MTRLALLTVVWLAMVGCASRAPTRETTVGHREIAQRWIAGQSLDQIAADLGVDREDARVRVMAALRWMKRRVPDGQLTPDEPAR